MTLDELKKAAQAARLLTVPEGSASFTLAVPTGLDMLRLSNASERDGDSGGLFNYRLVRDRLTAWDGVTEADVAPGAAATALPFDREAAELYFATRPALVGKLASAVLTRYGELQEAQEAARKN